MPCERITFPGGIRAIVCSTHRRRCCACGRPAALLCDWKVEGGTCDAPVCKRCTTSPAPDKDLCPAHVVAFEACKADRAARGADRDLSTHSGGQPSGPAPFTHAGTVATAPGVLAAGARP